MKAREKETEYMTPNVYQAIAMKTCPIKDPENHVTDMLTMGALGLTGEAGECADLIKKHLYQGHDLDKVHLAKELGDVAWYIAATAYALGYKLEDIFKLNLEKHAKRYPNGTFDVEHSLHRAEDDI